MCSAPTPCQSRVKPAIEVIDVHPLIKSYPGGTTDVVHYANQVFQTVEQMLEKHKVDPAEMETDFKKIRVNTCTSWETLL